VSDPRIKPRVPKVNPEHPLARGLVAAWPMSDGGGPLARDASGKHDGVIVSAPVWEKWRGGDALDFNGTTDWIQTDITRSSWDQITVSAWFNIDSWSSAVGYRHILGKGSSYVPKDFAVSLLTHPVTFASGVRVYWNGGWYGTGDVSSLAPAGTWNHLCMVVGGSLPSIGYLNGVVLSAANTQAPLGSSSDAVRIAAPSVFVSNDRSFNGSLSDVRLWDRQLTQREAVTLYQDSFSLYRTPEPVLAGTPAAGGFFQFDQLTGGMPDLRGGMV
jgi:hypothetical protein